MLSATIPNGTLRFKILTIFQIKSNQIKAALYLIYLTICTSISNENEDENTMTDGEIMDSHPSNFLAHKTKLHFHQHCLSTKHCEINNRHLTIFFYGNLIHLLLFPWKPLL